MLVAFIGYWTGRKVPPAPPQHEETGIDWHIVRSSIALVRGTMHIKRLYLAILSISFFWTIGAVLFIQFPPLVKNILHADKSVASLFLAVFSIGIAIGSVAVNRLLKGEVSARYSPASVVVMGAFVVAFYFVCRNWEQDPAGTLYGIGGFLNHADVIPLLASLMGIAISGGMFVVPLYAFLTTTVPKDQTARTVAANNIVNSGAMVAGSLLAIGLGFSAASSRGGKGASAAAGLPLRSRARSLSDGSTRRTRTGTTPWRCAPSASAAPFDRSMMRPPPANGPRSLTRTRIRRPLSSAVTST